eukprot:3835063-Pleurochrysis_carterae.AAC.1
MTSNIPHVASPCGRLRRASAARLKPRPMARAPSHTVRHRFARRACVAGCAESRITVAITVNESSGWSHIMRLAFAVAAL